MIGKVKFRPAIRALGLAPGFAFTPPALAQAAPAVVGPAETVFDWSVDRCGTWDIPDTPARAWRGADGLIRLVAGSSESRASVGPSLGWLVRDCAVLHRGAEADDPAAYDDRSWIHSTYRLDGTRIAALAHVEFHGHRRRTLCPVGDYSACWRNAVVELVSEDGGRRFRRAGLMAALPYRYAGDAGRRSGYFNPSNMFRRGDHLYAFVFAEAAGAQRRGPCLLRRPVAGAAADWRAWDGIGFAARFADPYRGAVDKPAAHVCAPVAGVTSTISSVVHHPATDRYLAVTATTRPGVDGVARSGVYWTTSADLLDWTTPELLWQAPLLWRRDCAAAAAHAYPSLLDEDSASANFETVDGNFWLYLVVMPLDAACRVGPERDLVRLRVSWPAP